MKRFAAAGALVVLLSLASNSSHAATLDRVVARFSDPESGEGSGASFHFVMMRELILEGWLTAYEKAAPTDAPGGFDDKALRAALERHVIEDVLAERLPASTPPKRIERAVESARLAMRLATNDRVNEILEKASGGTGGGSAELETILLRRARAEVYLEVAVAEPADVTEGELRAAWAHPPPMLASMDFEKAVPSLRVLVRAARLRDAAQAYYQAVRARLHLEIIQAE